MVCLECVEGGPLYSLVRSVLAKTIHGNTENRLQEDQNRLPAKMHLDRCQGGFGRTPGSADSPAASGYRLSLVHCLVGPDVGTSVLGLCWSVWSCLWASFACDTQDVIFCDFVCVFFVFSSYSRLVLLKT